MDINAVSFRSSKLIVIVHLEIINKNHKSEFYHPHKL